MEELKTVVRDLQNDIIHILQSLSKILISNSVSKRVISTRTNDLLCDLERLCVKARVLLDKYVVDDERQPRQNSDNPIDIAGSIEVTDEGWLHISLNTLLPNIRRKSNNYIGDTVQRLVKSYAYELPYFERAFMAIVEYCDNETHNALDNDNKGWKMIPNALKGTVIEDDNQFILSVGLFSKLSNGARCEIYILPPEDGSEFMLQLEENVI